MTSKKAYPYIVSLLFTLVFSGCGPTTVNQLKQKQNSSQIAADKVFQLVEGNTFLFESINEDSFFYFDQSGRVYGKDIYENKDIGKWDVAESGELCMKMQKWWSGDLKCMTMYTTGDKFALANTSGVIVFNAACYQGDYKKLYYEPKEEKKSYRQSIRQKQNISKQENANQADSKESSVEKTTGSSSQNTYSTSDAEIKSTVKWMAKDCPGCNLENTNLKKAELTEANLRGADLSGADLSMSNLRRADLQDANLEGADLSFANLPGANLRNCNLRNANLKGANLIRANLIGANLDGVQLEGALLDGTLGIE